MWDEADDCVVGPFVSHDFGDSLRCERCGVSVTAARFADLFTRAFEEWIRHEAV